MLKPLLPDMWKAYFDRISTACAGHRVQIEVSGLDIGSQIETDWVPLTGLTYDPKDEALMVAIEGMEHNIRKPQEIHIDEDAGALAQVAVVDNDGHLQVLRLKAPLALPSA